MLEAEMMLCVMMFAAGRRRLSKQSVSQCVKYTASGVDNAASPTGRHR